MISYIELFGVIVLLMLPLLYETSHKFRYYFKFLIYYGLVSAIAIALIPVFLLRPCDVRNLLLASVICRRIAPLLSLRWELRGKEHLEKERACIIVANHQSSLDVMGMFIIWDVMNKCTVVAKRELFYAWPFGLAAWLAGLVFIDRVRGEKARDTLNAVNRRIRQDNIKLWVFPEGTRRNTGDLHSFKKGAFHMAIDEQIPILPVVFSSYCSFLNDKKKILNPGHIIVTTLPAVSTEGMDKNCIPDLIENVHRQMAEVLRLTSTEVMQRYKLPSYSVNNEIDRTTEETMLESTSTSTSTTTITATILQQQSTETTMDIEQQKNNIVESESDSYEMCTKKNNMQPTVKTSL